MFGTDDLTSMIIISICRKGNEGDPHCLFCTVWLDAQKNEIASRDGYSFFLKKHKKVKSMSFLWYCWIAKHNKPKGLPNHHRSLIFVAWKPLLLL